MTAANSLNIDARLPQQDFAKTAKTRKGTAARGDPYALIVQKVKNRRFEAGDGSGLDDIARIIHRELSEVHSVAIYRVGEKTIDLVARDGGKVVPRLPREMGTVAFAAGTGRPVNVTNTATSEVKRISSFNPDVLSELAIPVLVDGETTPSLVLFLNSLESKRFDDSDIDGCAEIARLLADYWQHEIRRALSPPDDDETGEQAWFGAKEYTDLADRYIKEGQFQIAFKHLKAARQTTNRWLDDGFWNLAAMALLRIADAGMALVERLILYYVIFMDTSARFRAVALDHGLSEAQLSEAIENWKRANGETTTRETSGNATDEPSSKTTTLNSVTKWKEAKKLGETLPDFVARVYARERSAGSLSKAKLRSDMDLYTDYFNWRRKPNLPSEVQWLRDLPTKKEYHDHKLAEVGVDVEKLSTGNLDLRAQETSRLFDAARKRARRARGLRS